MTTLREAREKGKLDQFIREREAEAAGKGDGEAFDRGLRSMAGKGQKSAEKPE